MGYMMNTGAHGLLAGTISWTSDTIKCRLVLSADTPDEDATVMTGIGVTGNDQTLGTKVGPTKDDANDRTTYAAANPTFSSQTAGAAVNKVVIFKFVTNDGASVPIAVLDIDAVTPNGGDIAITFAGGLCFVLNNQPA